ncbi:Pro-apoptotic serine protease nma111 [Fusarium oxysporum f. sp. conglutinans]|nr:Pro-apoptotic serine protease nma111 [Fusarium oxysporum f. sp. conglutinans]
MDLIAVELAPGLATVGTEIKLIGNDSGESGASCLAISVVSTEILLSTHNTPTLTHATTKQTLLPRARSSGSPVFNVDGLAIGLQAGGISNASTDYFLPLDAPQRVLKQIQNGGEVKRGDIQTVFKRKPFLGCQHLRLSDKWESLFRKTFPNLKGLIVAEKVLPEGPSDGKLEAGDILIKINGKLVDQFRCLNTVLDENVGQTDIAVQDLNEITPSCFFSFDRTILHDISYQVAHRYGLACSGVFRERPWLFPPPNPETRDH